MKKKSITPKKTITRIYDTNYGIHAYCALGHTTESLSPWIKKQFPGVDGLPHTGVSGSIHTLMHEKHGTVYVLRLNKFDGSTSHTALLIHELHHLTHLFLTDIGMPYADACSEAYAYYIQYLFAQFSFPINRYLKK